MTMVIDVTKDKNESETLNKLLKALEDMNNVKIKMDFDYIKDKRFLKIIER